MNKVIEKEEIKIENMIYEIRGKQVMLDSDLAKLYQCKNGTKDINKAVKRNIERFPKDFYFQLTKEENSILRFQIGTTNNRNMIRSLPYVFTEQGVAMLSSVLRTEIATNMSIKVIRAFVEMRKFISNNLIEQKNIYNQIMRNTESIIKNTEDIKLLQESFDKLSNNKEYDGIFFSGQIYDSYSLLLDIFNTANNNIIIIDNYIDKKLLDILRNINKNILIITNKYNNEDYIKYKSQYNNIKLKINNNIHDRFIIIDNKELYQIGASLKDLGKKCFAINKIENKEWLNNLLTIGGTK